MPSAIPAAVTLARQLGWHCDKQACKKEDPTRR